MGEMQFAGTQEEWDAMVTKSKMNTGQVVLDSKGTSVFNPESTLTYAPSGTTVAISSLYSKPELIDTIVYADCIELVYRRQYMVSNNWGMPEPEIYAEVYSRTDGTMITKQGRYVPAQEESYEF